MIDRQDKKNIWQMRLGNIDLLLLEDKKGKHRITILNTKKTYGFLYKNINEHCVENKNDVAISLFGEEFKLDITKDEYNITRYFYNNKEVFPLYYYCKESNILSLIAPKLKVLENFTKNSWFTYEQLSKLENRINLEFKGEKDIMLLEDKDMERRKQMEIEISETMDKLHKENIDIYKNRDETKDKDETKDME